ncbi:MAG TPA: hypothetical protein VK563_10475 [Puia sp.]|nr:hypothetical protein [Puia sp.]
MKHFLSAAFLAVISLLGINNPVFSQKSQPYIIKMPAARPLLLEALSLYNSTVSTKAIKDFRNRFGIVKDEKWVEYKDRFVVSFTTGDIQTKVEYDRRGNWSGTERDYTEAKLESGIRKIVRAGYADFEIYWVREITLPYFFTGPVYILHIENDNNIKTICVYDEDLKVVEEYPKS